MSENIEVEARFKVENLDKTIEKLKEAGAKLNWSDSIEDYNFTLKHRDFWKTVEGLRIRIKSSEKGGTLTYKPSGQKAQKVMAVQEFETHLENPDQLIAIFPYIDVVPLPGLPYVKKTRYDYYCDEFHVIIDEYPLVGNFIEIEKVVKSKSEVESAKGAINKLVAKLGFSEADRQEVAVGFLLKEEYLKREKHA